MTLSDWADLCERANPRGLALPLLESAELVEASLDQGLLRLRVSCALFTSDLARRAVLQALSSSWPALREMHLDQSPGSDSLGSWAQIRSERQLALRQQQLERLCEEPFAAWMIARGATPLPGTFEP